MTYLNWSGVESVVESRGYLLRHSVQQFPNSTVMEQNYYHDNHSAAQRCSVLSSQGKQTCNCPLNSWGQIMSTAHRQQLHGGFWWFGSSCLANLVCKVGEEQTLGVKLQLERIYANFNRNAHVCQGESRDSSQAQQCFKTVD